MRRFNVVAYAFIALKLSQIIDMIKLENQKSKDRLLKEFEFYYSSLEEGLKKYFREKKLIELIDKKVYE